MVLNKRFVNPRFNQMLNRKAKYPSCNGFMRHWLCSYCTIYNLTAICNDMWKVKLRKKKNHSNQWPTVQVPVIRSRFFPISRVWTYTLHVKSPEIAKGPVMGHETWPQRMGGFLINWMVKSFLVYQKWLWTVYSYVYCQKGLTTGMFWLEKYKCNTFKHHQRAE